MIKQIISLSAAGLLALAIIPGSCEVIDPGHRGVSVTLGSVNPTVRPEGLNFKKPWIEKIVEMPVRQQTVDGKTNCFSSDLQLVQISYAVMYRIPEFKVVELYQSYQGDPYDSLVRPRLEEQMKQVTSAYKSEDLVKNREVVKGLILTAVKKELAGLVEVEDILLRNIDLSKLLEEAIEQKQVRSKLVWEKCINLRRQLQMPKSLL